MTFVPSRTVLYATATIIWLAGGRLVYSWLNTSPYLVYPIYVVPCVLFIGFAIWFDRRSRRLQRLKQAQPTDVRRRRQDD